MTWKINSKIATTCLERSKAVFCVKGSGREVEVNNETFQCDSVCNKFRRKIFCCQNCMSAMSLEDVKSCKLMGKGQNIHFFICWPYAHTKCGTGLWPTNKSAQDDLVGRKWNKSRYKLFTTYVRNNNTHGAASIRWRSLRFLPISLSA
jgi:hypothetical protein